MLRSRFAATAALVMLVLAAGVSSRAADNGGDAMTIRGKVIDPDGKPLAGAKVTVPSTPTLADRLTRKLVAQTTSGPDGRFEMSLKKSDLSPFSLGGGTPGADAWKNAQVVASADGFGLAYDRYDHVDAAGELVLKLAKDDVPIEGRVLNLEGAPVAGVKVLVRSIAPVDLPPQAPPPGWAQRAAFGAPMAPVPQPPPALLAMPFQSAGIDKPIVSGKDGRFRITGIGRDRRVELDLHGPMIGYARIDAATRAAPATLPAGMPNPIPPNVRMAAQRAAGFGAKFNYTATAGRVIEGTVRDAVTKQPVAGVIVESLRFGGAAQSLDPVGLLTCVSDEQGHYKLEGFPKGKDNAIVAVPSGEQPYFARQAKVEDEPGLKPITLDLELHKGVFIAGKVTDKVTGQPVPARIGYTTYVDNKQTEKLPEFNKENGVGIFEGDPGGCETRPDGSYRFVAAPGKAIVTVTCLNNRYRTGVGKESIPALKDGEQNFAKFYQPFMMGDQVQTLREVDVPEGARQVACDLQLDPGLSIEVTVVDVDEELAPGPLQVRGDLLEKEPGVKYHAVEQPVFNAVGFGPGDGRWLFVLDDARKLGRAAWLDFDEISDRKTVVKLLRQVELKGRLMDPSNKPMPHVKLDARQPERDGKSVREFETDEKGRFSVSLPIGTRYAIYGTERGQYGGQMVGKNFVPQQGDPVDLGDVKFNVMMNN